MSDNNNNNNRVQPSMADLISHVGSKNEINLGDKVSGKVISITKKELIIDIENIGLGMVRGKELYNEEYLARLSVGETVEALVINLDNNENCIECSFRAIGRDKIWGEISELFESKTTIEAKIRDANRGGFVIKVNGVDGFMPASQLAPAHQVKAVFGEEKSLINQMKKYVGQTFNVKVISMNNDTDTIVVSEKAVSDEISAAKLSKYSVGDIVDATIVGVVDFGVFLRFDEDLEGLCHISELAWKKIEDIKKEVTVSQKVKAKIIEIDGERRINLSIKQTLPNPWVEFAKSANVGDTFTGKVVKIVTSGAIVVNEEIQGFCHISQITDKVIDNPSKLHSMLKVGETKEFTIISTKDDKLSLTLLDIATALKLQEEQEAKIESYKKEQ